MKIGIIGAGASGMMAAIAAAENGGEVTLMEKNERVGKKILSTGNGKCNISNLEFNMDKYYCADKEKLHQIFTVFSLWDTIAFFENNGMMVRNKNGYLYPYSEQASTVLDYFRKMLAANKISVETECEVISAKFCKGSNQFEVKTKEKSFIFDKLIIACGGPASMKKEDGMSGFAMAESFGHTISKVVPGLVQLKSDESFLKAASGVRAQAQVSLVVQGEKVSEEQGELQFTDYGLSGIPIFQFSREAAYALEAGKEVFVEVNLFPDYEEMAFEYMMRVRYELGKEATLEEFLLGTVNKKINQAMMKKAGYKPGDKIVDIGYKNLKEFMKMYRQLKVHITAANGMENAQVCAGGVDFLEVSTEMESAICPGLYFAGELIDVDGKCGGYNLQWAWTSGYIAGRNAAGNSTKELIYQAEEEEQNAEN
ncbi:MAG: aminoacetone oxidase family FAD-binding enzyme [Lachnospiraceae bacterium]|nr:aminoacetone oxidase family FAD-binding enzyme [Lachnospiraceae bacterium]